MSAICGIFHLDGRPLDRKILQGMMHNLAHRGIDGSAMWLDGPVGLGHQMLHTTPESITEKLPFFDSATTLAITADARIDNREELFEALGIHASHRTEMADSLLILKAYGKWGKECPKHLLGEFVFVLWDGRCRELLCATDPMGMRPLYYCHTPKEFVFSSEIKGIHATPDVPRTLNKRRVALMAMPAIFFLEREGTFFEGINLMPGATVMTISGKGINQQEYWTPDISGRIHFKSESEYVEAFQEIFFKAISARLRSAFPVTSLCSGGLDSSAVTGTAAQLLRGDGRRLTALSAMLPEGYQGRFMDERHYVELLKDKENLDIEYIIDPWRGPFDGIERLVRGGESPLYTSRHYLYTAFADATRRLGGRIVLDGTGGELGPSFHGDGYYAELFLRGHWRTLLREVRLRAEVESLSLFSLIKSQVLRPLVPHFLMARLRPRLDFDQMQKSMPLKQEFIRRELGSEEQRFRHLSRTLGISLPDHRRNQVEAICFSRRGKPGNAFVGYERMSLAHPFWDRRVIEFCLALPGTMKISRGYKRYPIRAGMHGILCDELRFRMTKELFSPDFHDRYNRQKSRAMQIILSLEKNDLVNEIIDVIKLRKMIGYDMQTNRCDMLQDFAAMHGVPRGIYLAQFLAGF